MPRSVKSIIEALGRADLARDKEKSLLEELAVHGEAATPALGVVLAKLPQLEALLALDAMPPAVVAREIAAALGDRKRRVAMSEHVHTLAVHGTPAAIADAFGEPVVSALLSCLDDAKVRRSAIPFALGRFGANDERVFPKLVELVGDDDSGVRWSTAHGLKYFGDRAVPQLVTLLDDFGEADLTAVRVLATIGTPLARAALAKAAKRRGPVGRKAKDELGSMSPLPKRTKPKQSTKPKPRSRSQSSRSKSKSSPKRKR